MSFDTQSPHWEWYYVAMYFYIGGVSAGAYFIGSLAELFGGEKHREISRAAFYIAFPLILITPLLLIADLGQPGRFWHLFFYVNNGLPYINLQSPLSVGSWALLVYGGFSLLSFMDNLVADGRLKFAPFAHLYNRIPCKLYAVIGSAAGFFVAGYTGVLLNITARSLWEAADPLIGALFIASGGSTGAAAIVLAMEWQKNESDASFKKIEAFERVTMILELVLVAALIIIAWEFAAPLLRWPYGFMFWGGTVVLGILIPLWLYWYNRRYRTPARSLAMLIPILVLLGGMLLRISLVQAGQI